jgi:recombination protein RecT
MRSKAKNFIKEKKLMTTEITTTKANSLKNLINSDSVKAEIARALPKHMTPDRFLRVATTMILRTPKLADCSKESFMQAMLDCSALGLEPDGRRAHLIPYKTKCTLIIDYKGLIELAKRSGEVLIWRAEVVREKDDFSWNNGVISHKIDFRKPRGEAECFYSHVILKDGGDDYEVMTLEEVDSIRARSKSANNGPWVTDYDEMGKKTVIKRHSKRLTLSPEFTDALSKDGDRFDDLRNVTPPKELATTSNPFTALDTAIEIETTMFQQHNAVEGPEYDIDEAKGGAV